MYKYMNRHSRDFREQRSRELSQAQQLTLYSEREAPLEMEMKAQKELLAAYQWHMVSSRRQHAALQQLMDPQNSTLPLADSLVTYDWREKIKLPMAPVETGAMWHAQQKVSLSCWGGAVMRHAESSTAEAPRLQTTFVFYVTEVVEQTAEASNLMLAAALSETNVSKQGALHLWSDTGPHYRSAENLYYYARTLPKERNQKVFIRWLGEQHGKGILDQFFGVSGTHRNGWLGQYAAKKPIYNIDDVVAALKAGAQSKMEKDTDGPRFIVRKIEYPEHKSTLRHFLYANSLKISRTYALEAEPYRGRANWPPSLWNTTFADVQRRHRVSDWRVECLDTSDDPVAWRKAYLEGAQEWLAPAPDPHKDSHLKRVFESQKGCPPPRALLPEPTFQERIEKQEKRRQKAKDRLASRLRRFQRLRDGEEDAQSEGSPASSSDSSSSSSSESS